MKLALSITEFILCSVESVGAAAHDELWDFVISFLLRSAHELVRRFWWRRWWVLRGFRTLWGHRRFQRPPQLSNDGVDVKIITRFLVFI